MNLTLVILHPCIYPVQVLYFLGVLKCENYCIANVTFIYVSKLKYNYHDPSPDPSRDEASKTMKAQTPFSVW